MAKVDWGLKFMYELLYPAVLGAGIVGMAMRLASDSSTTDPNFIARASLGLLFLVFFCASFMASKQGTYTPLAFWLDVVEVVLMFFGFYWLRLFSPECHDLLIEGLYVLLIALIILQILWRKAVGVPLLRRVGLRVWAIFALGLGLVYNNACLFVTPAVTGITAILIVYYAVGSASESKEQN